MVEKRTEQLRWDRKSTESFPNRCWISAQNEYQRYGQIRKPCFIRFRGVQHLIHNSHGNIFVRVFPLLSHFPGNFSLISVSLAVSLAKQYIKRYCHLKRYWIDVIKIITSPYHSSRISLVKLSHLLWCLFSFFFVSASSAFVFAFVSAASFCWCCWFSFH